LIATKDGIEVADASTQAELEQVAREALEAWPEPLLAGSGGLAMEVARWLAHRDARRPRGTATCVAEWGRRGCSSDRRIR